MKRDIPHRGKAIIAADPESEAAIKYRRVQVKLSQVTAVDTRASVVVKKSHVGTRLLKRFKETVAAVPCSACKKTMIRLDSMTVEAIRAKHDALVIEIERNAQNAKASWWATLLMRADELFTDGIVTRLLISKLLTEACDAEERETASGILDRNREPADMDRVVDS